MPRLPLFLAAILAAFGGPAQAAAAAQYRIDAAHSHVQFSVDRFGFNAIIGEFRDFGGVITLPDGALAGGTVSATIRAASLVSGDDERDAIVKGEHWLDAARFPTIEFRSSGMTLRGAQSALVDGELTLLGVTRPVVLEASLNKRGTDPSSQREAAGFTAAALIKRSEFGLETAGALIGDVVRIRIEIIAHRLPEDPEAT
jgi:polyisoprenoid-binding protein YceI